MRIRWKRKTKNRVLITRTVTLECGKVFVVEERPDGYGRIIDRRYE